MPAEKKHPKGIRKIPQGWQAYVRVQGQFLSKHFPAATSLTVMKQWREEQRVRVRLGAALPDPGTTLREDAQTYLQQVRTMPTLRDRRDDLMRWIRVFGSERPRKSITSGEIRAQLEKWRSEGYAANTCNHRRTALMHLWTVLDGKSAPNPARDVPRYHDDSADAPPRDLSQPALHYLLEALRDGGVMAAVLLLFAWTGWPPAQIARLQPQDIRWDDAVYVRPRRKGGGAAGAWLPLLPQAWDALKQFRKAGAWGKHSTSSMRTSLRRAARRARRQLARDVARRVVPRPAGRAIRAELLDVTPYQFRHSFGTLIAFTTRDDRAVQTLLQHADLRTTHRYTKSTADPRAAAALSEVATRLRSGAAAQNP